MATLKYERLHITESVFRLGGVESLICQILHHDENSRAAGILDMVARGMERFNGLRKHRFSSASSVRRMAKLYELSAKTVIWHNFAGLMMCGGVIPFKQSILFLHTNSQDVFDLIPARIPYLHGILTSGDDLKNLIYAQIPSIPFPVLSLQLPLPTAYLENQIRRKISPIVIGYSGRIETTQKKVLRLRDFCRALDAFGIQFCLEILGSGSAEKQLRKILKPWSPSFLGQKSSDEVMKIYSKWDYSVCCSDYETGPLSILEGMVAGALPIFPAIPSQASRVLQEIEYPRYLTGEMISAAAIIQRIEQEGNQDKIRERLNGILKERTPVKFINDMNQALGIISQESRKVKSPPIPHGFKEYLPFILRSRIPEKEGYLK